MIFKAKFWFHFMFFNLIKYASGKMCFLVLNGIPTPPISTIVLLKINKIVLLSIGPLQIKTEEWGLVELGLYLFAG